LTFRSHGSPRGRPAATEGICRAGRRRIPCILPEAAWECPEIPQALKKALPPQGIEVKIMVFEHHDPGVKI